MMKRSLTLALCASTLSALIIAASYAQGTAFTYQGYLKQS